MKTWRTGLASMLAILALAGAVEACTAEDALNRARDVMSANNDVYKKAMDVTREMVDEEGITTDTTVMQTGAGTLMMEANSGINEQLRDTASWTHDDWRTLRERQDVGTHGLSRDFMFVSNAVESDLNRRASVREHMRQHMYDAWYGTTVSPYGWSVHFRSGKLAPWTYRGEDFSRIIKVPMESSAPPPPSSEPTPEPVVEEPAPTSEPTPVPAPLPVIHHAG